MSTFLEEQAKKKEGIKAKVKQAEDDVAKSGYKLKVTTKDTAEGQIWTVTLTNQKEGHTFVGNSSRYSESEARYLDALQKATKDMLSFENRY